MRERVVELLFFWGGDDGDVFFFKSFEGGPWLVSGVCKMWRICGGKDYLDEQEQQACGSLFATSFFDANDAFFRKISSN